MLDAHGVEHALLVGPNSGYGEDNRCLLDTLAAGAGRYRGMAVVANSATRAELAELRAVGVLGVTINAALLGVGYYADAGGLLADLAALDMIADVQVVDDQLVEFSPCWSAPACACTSTTAAGPIPVPGSTPRGSGSCCGGARRGARS